MTPHAPGEEPRSNVYPHVRTDAGARVLVERIDGLRARLEDFVTHARLYLTIGSAGVLVVLACWGLIVKYQSETSAELSSHEKHHEEEVKSVHEEIKTVRTEQQQTANRLDAKLDRMGDRLLRAVLGHAPRVESQGSPP